MGDYTVAVSAAGVPGPSGEAGSPGSAQASWSMGERAPYVRIVRGVTPASLVNLAVDHLTVEFSIPVDPATFTAADLSLSRDGGPNLLAGADGVTITALSATSFRIDGLSVLTQDSGSYRLSVFSPDVSTPAGTSGIGSYDLDWSNDTAAPQAAQDLRFTPHGGVSILGGLTASATGAIGGSLPQGGLTVSLFDQTTGRDLGSAVVQGTTFSAPVNLGPPGTRPGNAKWNPEADVDRDGYIGGTVHLIVTMNSGHSIVRETSFNLGTAPPSPTPRLPRRFPPVLAPLRGRGRSAPILPLVVTETVTQRSSEKTVPSEAVRDHSGAPVDTPLVHQQPFNKPKAQPLKGANADRE